MTLKETAYNNEVGINTKVLRLLGNSGVVWGIVRWTVTCTIGVRFLRRFVVFFSLRNLFIFCGLTENFLNKSGRKFFVYSGWGRVGVIE